jgi:hypothetical protein
MFAFLAAAAAAVGSFFLKESAAGQQPLIPANIDVNIDFWESNRTVFILLFLAVALWAVVRI